MGFLFIPIFIVAVAAFALSAVCGGGASFILLPVLGWVLPAAQVPAALSVGTAASSVSRMAVFRKNIRWDIVVWFVPPALPAVWLGARLLSSVDPVLLELLIGLFLVVNIPFLFKPTPNKLQQTHNRKWVLCIIGMATGFLSGLTGAVGLLFNRFYLTYGLTKEEIVATRAANELLLHILKIILYSLFGLLSIKALGIGIVISIAAVISAQAMKRLLRFFTEKTFRRIGFTAMVLSGVVMLINSGFTLYRDETVGVKAYRMDKGLETKVRWRQSNFAMEFEYDEGFEIERTIALKDLPADKQQVVNAIAKDADKILLEEVYSLNKHYYEVYIYKNGSLDKRNL